MRVAQNPGDYHAIHALIRQENVILNHTLKYPSIMFYEDGRLVGALCTTIRDNMIVAGPLVLDRSIRRPIAAIKLILAYENALRNLGIVAYILPAEENSFVSKIVDRYYPNEFPYSVAHGVRFYSRHIDGSQDARTIEEVEHGRA